MEKTSQPECAGRFPVSQRLSCIGNDNNFLAVVCRRNQHKFAKSLGEGDRRAARSRAVCGDDAALRRSRCADFGAVKYKGAAVAGSRKYRADGLASANKC